MSKNLTVLSKIALVKQAKLSGTGYGVGLAVDPKFAIDVGGMSLNGADGEDELAGDFPSSRMPPASSDPIGF